ncbi:class I SAM-dependent methyltransferase [Jeotgalibacillus soli]|uniref:Methyltransferase domain-containing protein n=1 Tax=Jeotgalibacillus soli TaxID=889306 RepID=A0A0C2R547_9BACL|nr:class I SAM-dependent methyltransferase [Jeotgalibacillus soli]KIL45380.1 hypothetical protein KP78_29240 [Jeotgalibacillus soli]
MRNNYLDLLAYFGIGGAHPGGLPLTKSILRNEAIGPSNSVLDIGCGTGQTAEYIVTQFNCPVTALDNHPIMVEKANERFKNKNYNVTIVNGNVENLPLPNNSFNFILSESVVTFTSISKSLQELYRVLMKNGTMILIEMTAEQTLTEEMKIKICDFYGIKEILSENEWKARIHEAGFDKIQIVNISTELVQSEINDLNPSPNIDIKYYDIWDQHNELTDEIDSQLGYRAFRCSRS